MSNSDNPPRSQSSPLDSGTPCLTFSSTESSVSVSSADPSPNIVFSALPFESESKFVHFVLQKLEIWHQNKLDFTELGCTEYLFIDIPISWGELVFTAIDKKFRVR
jgi:hypothetical protein